VPSTTRYAPPPEAERTGTGVYAGVGYRPDGSVRAGAASDPMGHVAPDLLVHGGEEIVLAGKW
jgi:hypothetical protein